MNTLREQRGALTRGWASGSWREWWWEITGANRLLSCTVGLVMGSCHALLVLTTSVKQIMPYLYSSSSSNHFSDREQTTRTEKTITWTSLSLFFLLNIANRAPDLLCLWRRCTSVTVLYSIHQSPDLIFQHLFYFWIAGWCGSVSVFPSSPAHSTPHRVENLIAAVFSRREQRPVVYCLSWQQFSLNLPIESLMNSPPRSGCYT